MSAPIVITVPTKYVPINMAPLAIKMEQKDSQSDEEESTSSMDEFLVRGKKRRLDHLTWEEKLQRKKLKNRVAAQTSRDRKKAKMEDMERTIQEQTDQISELQLQCDSLRSEKDAIYSKYLELETRFDELKRRLDEQQEQQQSAANAIKLELDAAVASHSVGSVSTLLGSAAGILPGNTNDTESGQGDPEEQRRKGGSALEDNCSLPALQDMLEDFDVSKLEELAESLLANVTSELESTARGSCPPDAQNEGAGSGVLGSVVGTAPEQLEPGQETDQRSSIILTTHNYSKSPFHVEKILAADAQQSHMDQQMVYGTYDNETNCITIVVNDDELPLEEEIICEEAEVETTTPTNPEQSFKIKLEPVQELLSPIPSTCSDYTSSVSGESQTLPDDEDMQPIFKCPLTPGSFVSDGGYESLGSPISSTDYGISSLDEFWNLDLFPILN